MNNQIFLCPPSISTSSLKADSPFSKLSQTPMQSKEKLSFSAATKALEPFRISKVDFLKPTKKSKHSRNPSLLSLETKEVETASTKPEALKKSRVVLHTRSSSEKLPNMYSPVSSASNLTNTTSGAQKTAVSEKSSQTLLKKASKSQSLSKNISKVFKNNSRLAGLALSPVKPRLKKSSKRAFELFKEKNPLQTPCKYQTEDKMSQPKDLDGLNQKQANKSASRSSSKKIIVNLKKGVARESSQSSKCSISPVKSSVGLRKSTEPSKKFRKQSSAEDENAEENKCIQKSLLQAIPCVNKSKQYFERSSVAYNPLKKLSKKPKKEGGLAKKQPIPSIEKLLDEKENIINSDESGRESKYFIGDILQAIQEEESSRDFCETRERILNNLEKNFRDINLMAVDELAEETEYKKKLQLRLKSKDGETSILKDIFRRKQLLVLDLDETLIHCVDNSSIPHQAAVTYSKGDGCQYIVYANVRPKTKEFLKEMARYFTIVIFTAAEGSYARALVDLIDPHRLYISKILDRRHCCLTQRGILVKDLRIFEREYPLNDILFVDNSSYCFFPQLHNGVPILPFTENLQDTEFSKLACYLKMTRTKQDMVGANFEYFKLYEFANQSNLESLKDFILEEF